MKKIVLAGGCFWGLEKFFDQFPGIHTRAGYANGPTENPSYQQVCQGAGHTEAVEVLYPDSDSLVQILAAFFAVVDPFSINRQGNDIGINYRSGIYVENATEAAYAKCMLLDIEKKSGQKTAVEVLPLQNFYPAEEYHQKYLDKNPQGYCHIPRQLLSDHRLPAVADVLKAYPSLKPFEAEITENQN